ncbi:FlgA, flagellar basal-body P-ring formation protein [Candidatus Filomicrobium marinum]|uniref:Flagella basal body P-ring formation protein FlgA n=1 Tax=Candidatus Filomicrobium marinum TaxID=1608628 RepID=A0A0D6JJM7_9HYPH|nr:flagellar basal body P-ring formation chaperone FlgA [Candidatus Filomicrobium marinum]CFX55444.1 FlgA, flagellar basal-body P-ring formation protein [Candidatus Filomicrobium marinum]CPR22189.1 FlgA, flagellar basal-body P-ring formation protein [Candidatus Filomicrobium marinum]
MGRFLLAAILLASFMLALPVGPSSAAGGDDGVYPVPRKTLYPGDVITNASLERRKFRFRKGVVIPYVQSVDQLVGMVARRTLLPGRPIVKSSLREPELIQRGQTASIVFQSGSLTISGFAKALEPGAVGDIIALRNVDSGSIVRGQIRADGSVVLGAN